MATYDMRATRYKERMPVKQLTFENLRLNRSVPRTGPAAVKIQKRLKHQAKVILAELKQGPLTTNQLRSMAGQYNSRINELRHYLREFGKTIDMTERDPNGNNKYEIRPFSGSRYQAELLRRSAKGRRTIDD